MDWQIDSLHCKMQGATAAKKKREGENAAGQISSIAGKGEVIIAETIEKIILLLQENLDQRLRTRKNILTLPAST